MADTDFRRVLEWEQSQSGGFDEELSAFDGSSEPVSKGSKALDTGKKNRQSKTHVTSSYIGTAAEWVEPRRKKSAIVRRDQFRASKHILDRVIGIAVLCFSYLGSVVACMGGVVAPLITGDGFAGYAINPQWSWLRFAGGMSVQMGTTWMQLANTPLYDLDGLNVFERIVTVCRQMNSRYLGSVAVGAGLSVIGYRKIDIVMEWTSSIVGMLPIQSYAPALLGVAAGLSYAAWGILVMSCMTIEIAPELILAD